MLVKYIIPAMAYDFVPFRTRNDPMFDGMPLVLMVPASLLLTKIEILSLAECDKAVVSPFQGGDGDFCH